MKDYFLIWRFFPKLGLGGVFVIELLSLIFGFPTMFNGVTTVFYALASQFSGATLLVTIILIIAVISNIGIFALNFISIAMRGIFFPLLNKLITVYQNRFIVVRDLIEPINEMALRLFKDNPNYYMEFFKLRNASAINLDKKRQVESFTKSVKAHMSSLPNGWVAEASSFLYLLSQDRRAIEIATDEVQLLRNVSVVCALGILALIFSRFGILESLIAGSILLFILLLDIQVLVRRKRFVAAVLISAYLNNFTVGPQAEVDDREGEILL